MFISKRAFENRISWFKPSLENSSKELLQTSLNEGLSYDSLKRSFGHGFMRPLDKAIWRKLDNIGSLSINSIEDAVSFALSRNKDSNGLLKKFQEGGPLPAPVVLQRNNGSITLVDGDTRLAFSKAFHVKPVVWWIKETELFSHEI